MRIPLPSLVLGFLFGEIAILIIVGRSLGLALTLGLLLAAALAGSMLIRRAGAAALRRMRAETAAARSPALALADGVATALAGCLLILPGFLSDAAALLLLVPASRRALLRRVQAGRYARRDPAPGGQRPAVLDLERDEYRRRDDARV